MRHQNKFVSIALAGLLACSILSPAEHGGFVKSGGLPVPGAAVTAVQGEKRVTAITDQLGAYTLGDLAEGVWLLKIEMLCFAPVEREVAVVPGAPVSEWELKLMPFEEIAAMAPTTPPAQMAAPSPAPPQQAAAAPKKSKRKAEPQPGNTPSGFQRADLITSANAAPPEQAAVKPDELNQAPAEGFLINGSVNNGAASPWAQSSAFGNNRIRRSLYNGSLGLVFNNAFWDARSYSLTGQNTPKPDYTRTQGSLAFGGPVKIPKLLEHGGPDVSVSYDWTQNRNATTHSGLVPTLAERQGDFSQTVDAAGQPVTVFDPTTGEPFPAKHTPNSRFSPEAAALLAFYPQPNFTGARYNYQVPLVGSTHQDFLTVRTYKNTRNITISGMFSIRSSRADSTNSFGFLDLTSARDLSASVSASRRLASRSFATLTYDFSRQSNRLTPFFAGRRNVSAEAGITGNNQEPANWGPPALNFASGIAALSDAQNSLVRNQTSGITAFLQFFSYRSHNVTVGGEFRRQQFNYLSQQDARGTFTFTGAAAGNDFAGFLLGIPDTSSIAFGNADKYFRSSIYAAYMSDDWRINSSLTINAGLRWEYESPIVERWGRLVNLDAAPGFAAVAPVIAATPSGPLTNQRYPDSLIHPDKRAVQPRIGLAWRPLPASPLVVRAGYGVYYDKAIYLPIAARMAQQSPLSKSLSVQNTPENPLTLANGFNAAPNITTNTFAVDPYFRPGYAQTWQASVQCDLPGSLVSVATYLGTKGTHAQQQFVPNTWPAGAANPCPACPAGFIYLTSNGNSTRHSGQFQLRRRLHSGFTAQMLYTFSKSIDDAALGGQGAVIAQNWLNLRGERGLSNFDQRHVVSALAQYTTGMGLAGGTLVGGWKGLLFKDWTFLTQIDAGSGRPQTPVYLAPVSGTGITGSIRPDFTGIPLYDTPPGMFLNPAAVAAPAPGHWGNAGRNSIAGPARFLLNASMQRTFRVTDKIGADFRLDSSNALNHPVYTAWNVSATSVQFGLPTATNAMRTMQATVRVRF